MYQSINLCDGKTVSLADEFDQILEENGVYKSFSLYKEKRFTRLCYQSGTVYECLPYFKQLLEDTHLNNLLIKACRIYLENDFIKASLKALANFTYKVTAIPELCRDFRPEYTL